MAGPSYSPGPGFGDLVNRLANPPNPMQQLGQTVNALMAVKNFQAQQASAQAYQQSVDPTTGEVDLGKYKALMSQGPGAFNFGPLVQQGGQAVGAVGQGTSLNVGATLDQLGARAAYLAPLLPLANKGQVTGQMVSDALATMPPGVITPELQANLDKQLAQIGPTGNASGIVLGGAFANAHAMEILKAQMPQYGGINTGGTFYPTQTNPYASGGVRYPTQGVPMTPSPDLMEKDVTVTLPGGGSLQNVPYWQAQAMERDPGLVHYYYPNIPAPTGQITITPQAGGTPGGGPPPGHYPAPPAPAPAAPGGGGGAPTPAPAAPRQQPAGTPSWAQPPPPPPAGAGGVGVTPSPSNVETVQKPSSAAATTLTEQVNATRDTMPLLDDMQSKLESGQLTTGVGSTVVGTLRGLMQRLKLSPTAPSGATDTATPQAIQDEFAKDAALLQAAQLKTLGNPTDARQELAMETNPGPLLSTYGNLGIVSMLKGNQYAIRAEGQAWAQAQRAGWDPTRFNEWQSQHFLQNDPTTGGRFDPRMFWVASMSPQQQRDYIGKLPPDQQASLGPNRAYALRMGWVTQRPDGTFVVANP